MAADTPVFDSLMREKRDAAERDVVIAQIRVSRDALPGSVVLMPVTPERARTLGTLHLLEPSRSGEPATVVADADRLYEIVLHPEDWAGLLVERSPVTDRYAISPPMGADGVKRVVGIPVADA